MVVKKKTPVNSMEKRKTTQKKKPARRRVGRPSKYCQKTTNTICELLASGKSLREICKRDDMPSMVTVFNWLHKYDEFLNQYARAREEQAEAMVDEILSIADEKPDYIRDDRGIKRIDPASVNRNKARVDARKWVAAKLRPKRYGDRIELNGADGGPVRHHVTYEVVRPDDRRKLDDT